MRSLIFLSFLLWSGFDDDGSRYEYSIYYESYVREGYGLWKNSEGEKGTVTYMYEADEDKFFLALSYAGKGEVFSSTWKESETSSCTEKEVGISFYLFVCTFSFTDADGRKITFTDSIDEEGTVWYLSGTIATESSRMFWHSGKMWDGGGYGIELEEDYSGSGSWENSEGEKGTLTLSYVSEIRYHGGREVIFDLILDYAGKREVIYFSPYGWESGEVFDASGSAEPIGTFSCEENAGVNLDLYVCTFLFTTADGRKIEIVQGREGDPPDYKNPEENEDGKVQFLSGTITTESGHMVWHSEEITPL